MPMTIQRPRAIKPPYVWVQCPNFQGSHKNSTTSRPSNASNGLQHQHIKGLTHMSHIIHPTINQETKTSTRITSNTKTNNQRSTRSKELNNGLKWDQSTTQGHLTKSMGNRGFSHCSKGFKLGLGQGQKGSSNTHNHKLITNPQGIQKGHQGLNSWNQ